VSFPWLDPTPPTKRGPSDRLAAQLRELRDRAAILFRLGYTAEAATKRLSAQVAWEHHARPSGLSDAEIGKAVRDTYARRPSGSF
jgi:hypothetical protein